MRAYLVSILLVLGLGSVLAQTAQDRQAFGLANQERVSHGLAPLAWSSEAYVAGLAHSEDMLKRDYFAHISPEGTDPAQRLYAAGVTEVTDGENLAFFEDLPLTQVPQRVVEDWMNSPHHRANLLNPVFTAGAISIAQLGNRVMVSEEFIGRPFPFSYQIRAVRASILRLVFGLARKVSVGLFVNGLFEYRLRGPVNSYALELLPSSSVSIARLDGGTYYTECTFTPPVAASCPVYVAGLHDKRVAVKGYRLELRMPPGNYVLSYGSALVPFKEVHGTASVSVPASWLLVWVSVRRGNKLLYAQRVPLK